MQQLCYYSAFRQLTLNEIEISDNARKMASKLEIKIENLFTI